MAFAERREMINLSFLNAIAGGGKSYCALQDAHSGVRQGGRVLYIAPTIALLEEAADTFRAFGSEIEPEVIHNATAQFVVPAILAALNRPSEGGRFLAITFAAFVSLPFFPGRERWSLIVDEIPQAATVHELTVPETHVHLTDHVELVAKGPVERHAREVKG